MNKASTGEGIFVVAIIFLLLSSVFGAFSVGYDHGILAAEKDVCPWIDCPCEEPCSMGKDCVCGSKPKQEKKKRGPGPEDITRPHCCDCEEF